MSHDATASTSNGHDTHPGTAGSTSKVNAIAKYHRMGNTWGIYLPLKVRQAMGLLPGDLIIIRVFGKRAILSRFDAAKAAPVTEQEHSSANGNDSRSQGR